MKRHWHIRLFAATWLGLLLWGVSACASYTDETRQVRDLYLSESYSSALKSLDESGVKSQERNRLLYRLERAMILDRMGDLTKSRALLLEADKIADELYTVSVTKTAASFIVNDATTDYSGEDYEKVAIHTQLALSLIGSGDLPGARVEARKINSKLLEINQKYDDRKNRYAEDAFARYLSGMIYEARGEWDDAIIDYKKAIDLYATSFSDFVRGGVPRDLLEAQARLLMRRQRSDQLAALQKAFPSTLSPSVIASLKSQGAANQGEVIVIHELGTIAPKRTQEFVIPLGKHLVRLSFPVIARREGAYGGTTGLSSASGSTFFAGDNVSDLDAIAHATLEDRRLRLIAKSAARLIAKAQLTDEAQRQFGPLGWLLGNIYSVVTETADTRGWTLLPRAYFVTRARLAPGEHTLRVITGGRVGNIEKVTVRRGEVLLLRAVG